MARLIDIEDNLVEDPNKLDLEEQAPEPEAVAEPVPDTPDEDDDIPEKYRGKSARELIKMHQEAEKLTGRQGSEVGELRKLVDRYIQSQHVEQAPPPEKAEEVDWFADPDRAMNQRLETHPAIQEVRAEAQRSKREANAAKLAAKHPDFPTIVQDDAFAQWIQASPVRTRLFIEADRNYDTDAADELFTTWKERKQIAQQTAEADKITRKNEVRRASSGGAQGSNAPQAKKIYRRADIIDLINNDPDRYARLSHDIMLAYHEGRVK